MEKDVCCISPERQEVSRFFKIVYILAIATAPFLTLEPIWLMADITNALMIIPNLIALLGLRKVVISETKEISSTGKSVRR